MNHLPSEIVIKILKFTDIKTLSNMILVNKFFYQVLTTHKWYVIDSLSNNFSDMLPSNKETLQNYYYSIDFTKMIFDNYHFPENVINNLFNSINMNLLASKQPLSPFILTKYYKHLKTDILLRHQELPIDVIYNLVNETEMSITHWNFLFQYQTLPLKFLREFETILDTQNRWRCLSENKKTLTSDVIIYYADKLYWSEITRHGLLISIIEHFINKIDTIGWINISQTSYLTTEFISKWINNLNIFSLLIYQNLDEKIIPTLVDKIGSIYTPQDAWYKISQYQQLSKEFILTYKDHLFLPALISNPKIKRQFLYEIYNCKN